MISTKMTEDLESALSADYFNPDLLHFDRAVTQISIDHQMEQHDRMSVQ